MVVALAPAASDNLAVNAAGLANPWTDPATDPAGRCYRLRQLP